MKNINKNIVQIDPLIELQKQFCFFFLDNQNRVGLLNEIKMMKTGLRIDGINMYKIEDGKLHMRRFLESGPVLCCEKRASYVTSTALQKCACGKRVSCTPTAKSGAGD